MGKSALPRGVSNLAVTRVQYNCTVPWYNIVQYFTLPQILVGPKRFLAFRLLDFKTGWSQLHGKKMTLFLGDRNKKNEIEVDGPKLWFPDSSTGRLYWIRKKLRCSISILRGPLR